MDSYVIAVVLALIVLVVALYAYLYLQYRQRFLVYWVIYWALYFGKVCFDLWVLPISGLNQPLPVLVSLINQLHILVGTYLILLGTYGFLQKSVHQAWRVSLVAAAILGLAVGFLYGTYTASTTLAALMMAGAMIWSGLQFIQFEDVSKFGRFLTGGSLLLWGVHVLDKPFLRTVEGFVPWGYLIGAFLSILTAQGMHIIYFERMRQDLINSKEELENAEKDLSYLNIHDSLTGLYNRLYFEERMNCIQKNVNYESVGVAVVDIEGLKLINDTLGHTTGDLILTATANLISQAFPESDTIARVGGDEFAVLMVNCLQENLEEAASNLTNLINQHNIAKPDVPMGISIGIKVDTEKGKSLFELYKNAENAMYRNRLKNSNIARIAIVNTLGKAIQEKDYIAKDHSAAMKDIMELMGLSLGLGREKTEELRQLALFHDIGKVGIPEHILAKPGPLNKEEMTEMRRHSEIGARIAQTAPQLANLQDYILKHHERWDGKGYPLGLKGEEIPLECRILALADSYDAMISHRPYRTALSHETAVAELRKCSGSQFDPSLVELFIQLLDEHKELIASAI